MKHLILYKTNEHKFMDAVFIEKCELLDIICRFCTRISIDNQPSHRHILRAQP